ncbi:MAG: hypothetical protein ACRER2_03390 [Methylococcales bacterium]
MKIVICVFGVLMLITSSAFADVIATRTRTVAFTIGDDETVEAAYFIPLNNSGRTSMSFNTTVANQRVVIFFNAETDVIAGPPDPPVSIDIDILVDGVAVKPSNVTNAFFIESVTLTGVTVLSPGIHTVRVRGRLTSGLDSNDHQWSINWSSTIVMK